MGKLCRIRLLRPEGLKAKEEGVTDNELAVLTGSSEALTTLSVEKKPHLVQPDSCFKNNLKKDTTKNTESSNEKI